MMFKRLSILISLTLLLVLAGKASPGTIASDPLPLDDGMTGDVNAVLNWSPGDYAADTNGHDVYFGTDFNDVNDANTSSGVYMGRQDSNSYDPGTLTKGNTYYWRIDEINDTNCWKGDVWSFEVGKFHFVVTADMRGYHTEFGNLCQSVNSDCGGTGEFHVSPGDIDNTPAENRTVISNNFGSSTIWYPIIGNHEVDNAWDDPDIEWVRDEYDSGNGVRTALKTYTNQDGPEGCEETMYTWDEENVHFIALNVYWSGGTASGSDEWTADGDILARLRKWLAADLAKNTKPFVFVFGHEPAFPQNRHIGDSLDRDTEHRDAFWEVLESEGVQAYFCGHTHIYSKRQGDKDGVGGVWQIDCGNAGNDTESDGLTYVDVVVGTDQATFNVYRGSGTSFSLYESITVEAIGPIAYSPSPAYDTKGLDTDVVLSWSPGEYAADTNGHDVYFGTNLDDVNSATTTSDPNNVYMGCQSGTTYDPNGLTDGQFYYWRVDEVNDSSIWKGEVWKFSTTITVNVKTDLGPLGIYDSNAVGDGDANDTLPIQAAIDYVRQRGGTVHCPAGTYKVVNLHVYDDVDLVGDGIGTTTFRPHPDRSSFALLYLGGGSMRDFTAYGTLPADSGDNWDAGEGKSSHIIKAQEIEDGAVIRNVHSLEAKYDPLVVRGTRGLQVIDSKFDRAGRNVVSVTADEGFDEEFVFCGCDFGPLRYLYLFDIEPLSDDLVRDGILLDCDFYGEASGSHGTNDTYWGCFVAFKGFDSSPYYRRDVTISGCDLEDVRIYVNKTFRHLRVNCSDLDRPPEYTVFGESEAGGELYGAKIRGNEFIGVSEWADIKDDVTWSGGYFFQCNDPAWANDESCSWPTFTNTHLQMLLAAEDIEDFEFFDLFELANETPRELLDWLKDGDYRLLASQPAPSDGSENVAQTADLSWKAGYYAASHDVYFGTSYDTVNDANDPNTSPGQGNQAGATFDPGNLAANTSYYWRIDEVNDSCNASPWKGHIWSFKTVEPDLVGWWKLDESSGSSAADSSGFGNTGTVKGNPTWVTGKSGNCLDLDGTGDYVDCGNSSLFEFTSAMTLTLWMKVDAWDEDWQAVVTKGNSSWRLHRRTTTDYIAFACDGLSGNDDVIGTIDMDDGQWHHVAAVYNGSTLYLYDNGSVNNSASASGYIDTSKHSVYIGENSQYTGREFNGKIDDVRLYNYALTETQIKAIFNLGKAFDPNPAHNAIDVGLDADLSWQPGEFAASHNVYFGTSSTAVTNATDPNTSPGQGNQDSNTFDPGTMEGETTYYWRIDEVNSADTWKGDVWSFTTLTPPAEYTERYDEWGVPTEETWLNISLAGYGVPANAVVEIGMRNSNTTGERNAGVRKVGSSLDRKYALHEAESDGWDVMTMHVQANANSWIQYYGEDDIHNKFYLLGYWSRGTYVEKDELIDIDIENTWVDVDLSSYGVGANQYCEIMIRNTDESNEEYGGVRTNGSSLDRRVELHEPEGGGRDLVTMVVQTDATSKIEVYAQDESNVRFYLVGYWTTPPGTYTEKFANVGMPSSDSTWQDKDLSGNGVPASAVVEMVFGNSDTGEENWAGVRKNGSSLSRRFELQEAESNGNDFGRMHVPADADSIIEWYFEDISDGGLFYLVGYWE